MRRILKGFGFALASLLTVAACAAPAALAHLFHFEAVPALVTGEQLSKSSHVIENSTNGMEFTCKKARVEGTAQEKTTMNLRVLPVYEECLSNLGTVVTVKPEGCSYLLEGETEASGHARLQLQCVAGKKFEIAVGGCTAKLSSQIIANALKYTNEGAGASRDFKVTLTAEGLLYETSGTSCGTYFGNGKDLRITGDFTTKGFQDLSGKAGKQLGIWVE